jgi:hypothetical protein
MKKINASVLAFEKKLVPSDGLMFGGQYSPLLLHYKFD